MPQFANRMRVHGAAPLMALAASVVLGNSAQQNPPAPEAPAVATRPQPVAMQSTPEPATAPNPLDLNRLQRGTGWSDVGNAFEGKSWAPPVPPPPPAPPPPPPSPPPAPKAPALPFTYVGKLEEPGKATTYYLEHGPKVVAVTAGQNIDADYRLQDASKAELGFIYLPLQARQVLRIGE